jgi:hypothetical protein
MFAPCALQAQHMRQQNRARKTQTVSVLAPSALQFQATSYPEAIELRQGSAPPDNDAGAELLHHRFRTNEHSTEESPCQLVTAAVRSQAALQKSRCIVLNRL